MMIVRQHIKKSSNHNSRLDNTLAVLLLAISLASTKTGATIRGPLIQHLLLWMSLCQSARRPEKQREMLRSLAVLPMCWRQLCGAPDAPSRAMCSRARRRKLSAHQALASVFTQRGPGLCATTASLSTHARIRRRGGLQSPTSSVCCCAYSGHGTCISACIKSIAHGTWKQYNGRL